MTLSKISAFNKKFNTNVLYYNENDRSLYPKNYRASNTDDMILYLYENHFCLIDKIIEQKEFKKLKIISKRLKQNVIK